MLSADFGRHWAVTGGKVTATQPLQFDDIPAGPNKSVKVQGCMWGVSTMGQITISWFHGPLTDEEIAQFIKMTKSNPGVDDLKKANYKEVSKEFPQAWCSIMTPPCLREGWPAAVHLRRRGEASGPFGDVHEQDQGTHH